MPITVTRPEPEVIITLPDRTNTFTADSRKLVLTDTEARELYNQLHNLFGPKRPNPGGYTPRALDEPDRRGLRSVPALHHPGFSDEDPRVKPDRPNEYVPTT